MKWEVKDTRILSWILGSVEPSILLNLLSLIKPLEKCGVTYRKFTIKATQQERFNCNRVRSTRSRQYVNPRVYSSFENLWTEYTYIVYVGVPPEGLIAIQSVHETSKRDQF